MTELTELIAKLEAATKESRELDVAIERVKRHLGPNDGVRLDFIPVYTSSLDAALTLYNIKPIMISSNPRIICINALKAREKARQ